MPALADLQREHIEARLDWLYEQGNKPATVRNRYAGVQQSYNWAQHAGVRTDHPMARIPAPQLRAQVQPDYTPKSSNSSRRSRRRPYGRSGV